MFLKMANPIMTIFMKNFKNHLGSEFVKIQEFILNIIFGSLLKNYNLFLKLKIWKLNEIQPIQEIKR